MADPKFSLPIISNTNTAVVVVSKNTNPNDASNPIFVNITSQPIEVFGSVTAAIPQPLTVTLQQPATVTVQGTVTVNLLSTPIQVFGSVTAIIQSQPIQVFGTVTAIIQSQPIQVFGTVSAIVLSQPIAVSPTAGSANDEDNPFFVKVVDFVSSDERVFFTQPVVAPLATSTLTVTPTTTGALVTDRIMVSASGAGRWSLLTGATTTLLSVTAVAFTSANVNNHVFELNQKLELSAPIFLEIQAVNCEATTQSMYITYLGAQK